MVKDHELEKSAVIKFLETIGEHVQSLEDLLVALRAEIKSVALENRISQPENNYFSNYSEALTSIEKELCTQASIRVAFTNNTQLVYSPFVKNKDIEACILNILIRFIKEDKL